MSIMPENPPRADRPSPDQARAERFAVERDRAVKPTGRQGSLMAARHAARPRKTRRRSPTPAGSSRRSSARSTACTRTRSTSIRRAGWLRSEGEAAGWPARRSCSTSPAPRRWSVRRPSSSAGPSCAACSPTRAAPSRWPRPGGSCPRSWPSQASRPARSIPNRPPGRSSPSSSCSRRRGSIRARRRAAAAYYRSTRRDGDYEPLEPHKVPAALSRVLRTETLTYPRTGLPRDPYALRPRHLDTARGILDAAIEALDRRIGRHPLPRPAPSPRAGPRGPSRRPNGNGSLTAASGRNWGSRNGHRATILGLVHDPMKDGA